ncbi:MAG: magnesium transporter [Eubacteriales bacterium]|nr:magnesium transporter [Eubacteriales bacterium]
MDKEKKTMAKPEEIEADSSIRAKVNHPLSPDSLKAIIETHNTSLLNYTVSSYDPVNIAKALENIDSEEDLLFFFKAVNPDDSAEVFTHLEQESKEKVIQAFSSADLHAIVDNMATDDLVDFVDELPANLVSKVLKATSEEDRKRIYTYLHFKDDSAGTIMTPEYLQVKEEDTVKYAISKIRSLGQEMETIWEIFVVDNSRRLVGTITLDKLLEADEGDILKSVMTSDFVSVTINTDQEEVLKAFRKYDISVIPVTNSSKRMLGIITFDDVYDVAKAEANEDSQLTNAVIPSDEPYLKTNLFKLVKNYGIWLVVLLFLDTLTSMIMNSVSNVLAPLPLLIAILPSIMGTNGNASDQTVTVTIRELALGNITKKNYFKAMWKEVRASVLTGLILGVFAFGWILMELYSGLLSLSGPDNATLANFYASDRNFFFLSVAALVAITFFFTIVLAKLLGITLPVLAKMVHLDPAVMSQPLISTILDILSMYLFYALSLLIMKGI